MTEKPKIKGWTPIPNWVLVHPDLGHVDIAVYLCLSYHADAQTGVTWPSASTIMGETKIGNRQTLRNSLERLANVGAIDIHMRDGYPHLYFLPDRHHLKPDEEQSGR